MTYQNILVETKGRVGIIRFNRPQALNALNAALVKELLAAVGSFDADVNIGCILITGSDKAFAAGADIKEMVDKPYMDAFLNNFGANEDAIARARKPVVAAVAGFALGGGCEFAMQCDMIIAADNAKFGQPEIKLGVIPGYGGTQRLAHAVGKAKAMDLILTAGESDGGSDEGRRNHRVDVAAVGAVSQGSGQPRVRSLARRGRAVRAARIPSAVRHRGPERRHGGVRGEKAGEVQE